MTKQFSVADVAAHNQSSDLYIIIDEDVYDLTNFQYNHPGGKNVLLSVAGRDSSEEFWKYHSKSILNKYKNELLVGVLDTKEISKSEHPIKVIKDPGNDSYTSSQEKKQTNTEMNQNKIQEVLEPLGDMIPFGDPSWYQGYYSPYYNATHVDFRNEIRDWVSNKISPYLDDWEEAKSIPEDIYKEIGRRGYLAGLVGVNYCTEYSNYRVASVSPKDWDTFHELILIDELSRAGSGGFVWNTIGGFCIGCPPILKFGNPDLKKRILPGILQGENRICLAVTEPDAGSDIENLQCEAVLSEDGKHYIVNGEKKWITNGIWCDYFTTAVRTGSKDSGLGGLSVLLIERSAGGVNTRKMECQGVTGSGTSFITFENVKVPVENLLGKQNEGFKAVQAVRFARVCYEESVKYAHQRMTFGKPLIKHPVIRLKLGQMARQIEASFAFIEAIAYQIKNMPDDLAMLRLGGPIASLKAQSSITFEFCAREACQIFGGLSYSRGGRGGKIERLYRDVRAYAIPGGSEEIMLDLSIRQSLKVSEMTGMKL